MTKKKAKTKKGNSTYDKFIEGLTPKERQTYKAEYNEFVLSELVLALMDQDEVSVRKLAKMAGISPTQINNIRTGKTTNTTIKSFFKIIHSLGVEVVLKKDRKVLATF